MQALVVDIVHVTMDLVANVSRYSYDPRGHNFVTSLLAKEL